MSKKAATKAINAIIDAVRGTVVRELDAQEWAVIEHLRKHGTVPVEMRITADRATAKMKRQIRDLRSEKKYLEDELIESEERNNFLLAVGDTEPTQDYHIPLTHKSDEAVAMLLAGDWHLEEDVEAASLNGVNEFNLDIADLRVKRLWQRFMFLVERERQGQRVKKLVLCLLGDLITGYIHEELEESNNLSPTEASIFAFDRLVSGIEFLTREGGFDEIVVVCVDGNHGRTTHKRRIKTRHKNSYEWLLYNMLVRKFEGAKRLKFQVGTSIHAWVDVGPFPVRVHHGDSFRYAGGVGGPTVPINKKIKSWNADRKAYLDVFGHLHSTITGENWIMNGALIGYTEFALALGMPYQPPSQSLVMLDRRFGVTALRRIWLEEIKKK